MSDLDSQLALIKRGADELLIEAELVEKLKTGRPLAYQGWVSTRRHPTCTWGIRS